MLKTTLITGLAALALSTDAAAQSAPSTPLDLARIRPDFAAEIPNIPGKSLKTVIVDYPAGVGSSAHTHAPSAFILAYVLEGAVVSSVNGSPERVYRAGEHWTEEPGSHHGVSQNASATEPAKLLAIFVVDTTDTQLTIPDPH